MHYAYAFGSAEKLEQARSDRFIAGGCFLVCIAVPLFVVWGALMIHESVARELLSGWVLAVFITIGTPVAAIYAWFALGAFVGMLDYDEQVHRMLRTRIPVPLTTKR